MSMSTSGSHGPTQTEAAVRTATRASVASGHLLPRRTFGLQAGAAAALTLVAGVPLVWAQEEKDKTSRHPPESFPPSTPLGTTLDNKETTLADLHPRAVVVCFWASWCPHCMSELNTLERLQRAAAEDRLRVVLVNTEAGEDWRRLRRRLDGQLRGLPTHDGDRRVRVAFAAPDSVPYTVIIGRDGRSVATLSGWSEDRLNWLVDRVNAALASIPRAS